MFDDGKVGVLHAQHAQHAKRQLLSCAVGWSPYRHHLRWALPPCPQQKQHTRDEQTHSDQPIDAYALLFEHILGASTRNTPETGGENGQQIATALRASQ